MHAQNQVSVSLRCIEFILILLQAINAIKLIFTHMTNSDLHTMPIHCQTMSLRCQCEQPSLKVTSIKKKGRIRVYTHLLSVQATIKSTR